MLSNVHKIIILMIINHINVQKNVQMDMLNQILIITVVQLVNIIQIKIKHGFVLIFVLKIINTNYQFHVHNVFQVVIMENILMLVTKLIQKYVLQVVVNLIGINTIMKLENVQRMKLVNKLQMDKEIYYINQREITNSVYLNVKINIGINIMNNLIIALHHNHVKFQKHNNFN